MKPRVDNPYGYKICYIEKGSKAYVRKYMTHSYKTALKVKEYYLKDSRFFNLKKPSWHIIPITRKEVLRGIWREIPFQ